MEMVWKACAIGVLCATVTLLLRPAKGEYATLARIGGGVLILCLAIPALGGTVSELVTLFEGSGVEPYAEAMLRAIGIALLGGICADVCRETGDGMVASGVELAARLAILALCLPLIREILGFAAEILARSET